MKQETWKEIEKEEWKAAKALYAPGPGYARSSGNEWAVLPRREAREPSQGRGAL